MLNRKAIVRAAALTALLGASQLRAEVVAQDAVALKPMQLQTAEPNRKPLMDLLDKMHLADSLDAAKINVGGIIDGGYTYNLDSPDSEINAARSFDADDQDLTLNQLSIFAEKTVDVNPDRFDIGGRFDFMWGSDARYIHSLGLMDHYGVYNVPATDDADSPDNQFDLNQAYIDMSLPIGKGLKVRVGKFNTLYGYEVINPAGNAFYSHGLLFNYAIPLTNTGIVGTYAFSEKLSVTAGISRGWDTSLEDDNDTIDYLAQASYVLSDTTTLTAGIISGADQVGDNDNWRTVIDVILATKVGDNLTIAFNGDYGYEVNSVTSVSGSDAQWYGLAGYASLVLTPQFTLNVRAEYFNDEDGARLSAGVGGAELMEGSIGLAIRPFSHDAVGQNLVIRPEFRWDYADENLFNDGDDNNQFTAAIDAYFTF